MNSPEPAAPAAQRAVVEGRLFASGRTGAAGLFVEIVDCLVGQDVRVGSTLTEASGAFRAEIDAGARQAPDLQARVWTSDDDTATFVGESAVAYRAAASPVWLDVEVEPDSTALESEYEALERAVQPFVGGRLGAVEESDSREDVTHLAHRTGWDARAVAMAAQADRLAQECGNTIAAPFFYALLRAGLPASAEVLYRTAIVKVEAVWREATERGVVPRSAEAGIPSALEAFAELSVDRLLQADPLGDLLDRTFPADEENKRAFARLQVAMPEGGEPFWERVESSFGPEQRRRLQFDGRLSVLTLNNAALVKALHEAEERHPEGPLTATEDLARRSYFRPERWLDLLGDNVPDDVPGAEPDERKARYAEFLAAQVRLCFPTAVTAARVAAGDLLVAAESDVQDGVAGFLTAHVGRFELGVEPVERFLAGAGDVTAPEQPKTLEAIKRLQRVYQLTPDDDALAVLLANGLDSATKIAGLRESEFVAARAGDLGESDARAVHARAVQISDAVANIAVGFLASRRAPSLGFDTPIVEALDTSDAAAGVVATPTLEGLFGSLNVASCEQCESILSPAAYLVDLLHFIDLPDAVTNPLDVLLARRPDIGHLPLSCENTDSVLPHIDLVNETLEHFVAHRLSLQGFMGHSTPADREPDEILAQPEFVDDNAYQPLRTALFPSPLPFHPHLETLRALFTRLGVPLADVMLALRKNDEQVNENSYGLRDIAHEQAGVSPPEAQLLTDSSVPLPKLLGHPDGTPDAQILQDLSSVRTWATRLGLTYSEVLGILGTRFVNPGVTLKPRVARLGVSFADLQRLKSGTLSGAAFDAMLPPDLDRSAYGGDVAAWATDDANHRRIMQLLVTVPPPPPDGASSTEAAPPFDEFLVRRADPDATRAALQPIDAVRLVRFVRLWRKLGWTIEQTDSALAALFPDEADEQTPAGLDAGVLTVLDRLGTVVSVMRRYALDPDDQLQHLLACWADLETYGPDALYRKLFPAGGADPGVFGDNGFGDVLHQPGQTFLPQADALRAAFNLSADDFTVLVDELGFDEATPLSLATVSAAHRRAWLGQLLGLGQRELAHLLRLTGIDPFSWDGSPRPGMTELLDLLDTHAAVGTTPAAVVAVLGPPEVPAAGAQPDESALLLLRDLRARLVLVDGELNTDDVTFDDRVQQLLAARFGTEAAQAFTSLLSGSAAVEVPHRQQDAALPAAVVEASGCRIAYNADRGRLSYAGPLSAATRDALKAVADFDADIDALFASSEDRHSRDGVFAQAGALIERSLERNPDFRPLLVAHLTSADAPATRRRTLLRTALAPLREERWRTQALTAVVAGTGTPLALTEALLTDVRALHAPGSPDQPALAAVLKAGETGLEAVPGDDGSTVHRGYVDVTESGPYRMRVTAAAATAVTLTLDGADAALVAEGGSFRTRDSVALQANRLLAVTLTVTGGDSERQPALEWQRAGHDWQPVPPARLYGNASVAGLTEVVARCLAARNLAEQFSLGTAGIVCLARLQRLAVDGSGWLNALPVRPDAEAPPLGDVLDALLDFSRLRMTLKLEGDDLAELVSPADDSALREPTLVRVTGWDPGSLQALLEHRGLSGDDLTDVSVLRTVADAMTLAATLGTSVATLIRTVTPDPGAEAVRLMYSALRARHGSGWLEVLTSVNDPLRARRRDALVAFILRELRSRPETAHVDTPDKLFEFFLMDVQLEPCMRTSRVRNAISAVQLFVERVLMNLDPEVPAATFDSSRWKWMKRYRLWEANRQVFLWPENWLEPELRTDQSPAFRQALSELLQSDITDDTAAGALLGYLSRLEEVAKLEPCALHYDEGDKDFGDEVAHVIARTAGAQRKYYYRRRATGSWTAWEQINLDIEDNPVTPVLWRGRLLLFWLKLMSSAPPAQPMSPTLAGTALTNLTIGQVQGEGTQNVKLFPQAALCWSEYYNGRWQPPKTSNIALPTGFGKSFDTSGDGAFHRDLLVLGETLESDALRVRIWGQGKGSSFLFYNTHSLPERQEDRAQEPLDIESFARFVRNINASGPTLRISYIGAVEGETTQDVLTVRDGSAYRISAPFHVSYFPDGDQQSLVKNPWAAPFLYSDSRHAFYVTPHGTSVPFADSPRFGLPQAEAVPQPIPRVLARPETPAEIPVRFLIDSPHSLVHGDVEIAPTGRVGRPTAETRKRRPRHA
jgi:hypothetical protein